MDSMILAVTIFLLGCFAATIGSLLGLGGGVFIVPGLLYIQHLFASMGGITPQIAVGTSLLVVAITALSSTWAYTKQKRVDYGSGLFFFAASGPGVLIGAYMNRFFDEQSFYIVFGLFLLLMFYFMMRNKKMHSKRLTWHVQKQTEDEEGNLHQYGYHRYLALAICLCVGLLQGLLGIGGGSLLVPALVLLFWFPPHTAVATTMFTILLTSVVGSLSHIYMGNVAWSVLLWLAPGAWLGGQLGAYISRRMNSNRLTLFFKILLLLLAMNALREGVWG
jgi:uncharacterized protein